MNNKKLILSQIKEGKKIIITDIKDIFVKNHLNQLGISVNKELLISKVAVLGSPIALQTEDTEIAIRKDIADIIEVELI